MKMLLVLLLLAGQAHALDEKSVGGGFTYSMPDAVGGFDTDVDENSEVSFNAGLIGFYRTPKGKKFRTGIMLVSKKAEIKAGNLEHKYSFTYITAPLTMMKNYRKGVDMFYGISPGLLINDDCDEKNGNDKCEGNEATLVYPLTVGVRYNLDTKLNLEISYDYALRENVSGVKMNSLAFNVFYDL